LAADAIPTGQIFWYTVEGAGYDLAQQRAIHDGYVRPQLESVAGVAEVASAGGRVLEYHVEIDLSRLLLHGLRPRDAARELAASNAAVGGGVMVKGNSELVVRGVGWLGSRPAGAATADRQAVLRDIEQTMIPTPSGGAIPVTELARVREGAQPRRGVLEKDGSEVTGGVVLMRYGENPLEVTRRLRAKIQELSAGLPAGVGVVVCYDRTPLIEGAIRTVTGTLIEASIFAGVCVLLVHARTVLVVIVTLPLAALASFACMRAFSLCGIADIQTNIMSLSGIAISIGVLVDSSIVMAENAMVRLREEFAGAAVRGATGPIVAKAAAMVGRPIVFSVLIMMVSFLPVFALRGIDGKMYRPLAFTKVFALAAAALLAVTLVTALCTLLIKGRLRPERSSWIVRGVMDVYRPVLNDLLDSPGALALVLGVALIAAAAPLGSSTLLLAALAAALVACGSALSTWRRRAPGIALLVLAALAAEHWMHPLQAELRLPLDEGMVMDTPITVPRASIAQAVDDLKARNMVLCRFPEVELVLGKAGRVDSAFDPAPLDMIESMVMLRPQEFWPRRRLGEADLKRQARSVLQAVASSQLVELPNDPASRGGLLETLTMAALPRFNFCMREYAWQRSEEFARKFRAEAARRLVEVTAMALARDGRLAGQPDTGELLQLARQIRASASRQFGYSPAIEEVDRLVAATIAGFQSRGRLTEVTQQAGRAPGPATTRSQELGEPGAAPAASTAARVHADLRQLQRRRWLEQTERVNEELHQQAPLLITRILVEEALGAGRVTDGRLAEVLRQIDRARRGAANSPQPLREFGHHGGQYAPLPVIDPHPVLDPLVESLASRMARRLVLWPCDRAELAGRHGGKLDSALAMPGWTNVWTMPIQNRVDMLATGVNTEIGVRVLGHDLEAVVATSEGIADVLQGIPGAVNVIANPVRGNGYLEMHPDRQRASALGISVAELNEILETALGGLPVTSTLEGRLRHTVRLICPQELAHDVEALKRLPVPLPQSRAGQESSAAAALSAVPLEEVARIEVVEGPATIKSENGLLRNYVRLNVRGRDPLEFVQEARGLVAQAVRLPEQTMIEWTGQFEHALATRRSMLWLIPAVVGLIALLLYWTYGDAADAALMLLTVPGAMAGGVLFQWLFGYKFTMAVGVGYLACFGMAASTGMIMLVYLRQSIAAAGGLERLSSAELRAAVLDGAAQRLRPKLLTEATTLLGLAPMLWATGAGADVIRPMAAPVLGGILIADEVVDLLLPVLFYQVRKRRWRKLREARPPELPREVPALQASA
jgi:Cu(I)/Ag(I) efflux system membrane protein CusA/SilA